MPIKTQDTKFSFNGHQTFPLRYGWIEKICLELVSEFGKKDIPLAALQPDILVAAHGLGQNMAKSARYWLKLHQSWRKTIKRRLPISQILDGPCLELMEKTDIWRI